MTLSKSELARLTTQVGGELHTELRVMARVARDDLHYFVTPHGQARQQAFIDRCERAADEIVQWRALAAKQLGAFLSWEISRTVGDWQALIDVSRDVSRAFDKARDTCGKPAT